MFDGMGKMRGGKRRQHLALPSQLKQQTARLHKQTCFTSFSMTRQAARFCVITERVSHAKNLAVMACCQQTKNQKLFGMTHALQGKKLTNAPLTMPEPQK
jgi:hypothetical protein